MKTDNKKQYEKPVMDVAELMVGNALLAVSGTVSGEDPDFTEDARGLIDLPDFSGDNIINKILGL